MQSTYMHNDTITSYSIAGINIMKTKKYANKVGMGKTAQEQN